MAAARSLPKTRDPPHPQVAALACRVVWSLAVTQAMRQTLVQEGCVEALLELLKVTLTRCADAGHARGGGAAEEAASENADEAAPPEAAFDPAGDIPGTALTRARRDECQARAAARQRQPAFSRGPGVCALQIISPAPTPHLLSPPRAQGVALGALSVLIVDAEVRKKLIGAPPPRPAPRLPQNAARSALSLRPPPAARPPEPAPPPPPRPPPLSARAAELEPDLSTLIRVARQDVSDDPPNLPWADRRGAVALEVVLAALQRSLPVRVSFADAGVGALLPLLAAPDRRLRVLSAAALATYAACPESLRAVGTGRTKPKDILGACLKCAEDGCNDLRLWSVSAAAPKASPRIQGVILLVEVTCRAIWAASAASVQPEAKPLTRADLDVLCDFGANLATTEAPIGPALRNLCGALSALAADEAAAKLIMETVDRRTEMPVIESCIYRALERSVANDTRVEETRAAAVSVVGNLSAHVLPADPSAADTGPDRALAGTHRVTLVQGNCITHVSGAVPKGDHPDDPAGRAVALDLENNACLTLMFACTVDAAHVTEEEVEAVLRAAKSVGRRNPTALQWLAAALWCLARSDDTRAQLLETDAVESLISLLLLWLPQLGAAEDPDAPVVKFSEFAVAALWLLVIAPGEPLPEPETLVEIRDSGIWTQHFPEPASAASAPRSKRSTSLLEALVQLLELPAPADTHATVCHLAAGLCWNMCARDRALQALFAERQGPYALRRVAAMAEAPAALRSAAMGHLLASPLEDPGSLDAILVSFVRSGNEQLETVGARGMAFLTQSGDRHCKVSLARSGAVTALCALLKKQLNRGVADTTPDDDDGDGGPGMAAADLREADMTGVSQEGHLATLMALLNLSTEARNQVEIGAKGLTALIRARKAAQGDLAAQVVSGTLSNLTLHPGNATRMYRCELREKAAAAARARQASAGSSPGRRAGPAKAAPTGPGLPGQHSQASQLAQSMRKARADVWLNPHNPGGAAALTGEPQRRRERAKAGTTLTQKGLPLAPPWDPPVREYVQVTEKVTSAATKLLLTERPNSGAQRLGETMTRLTAVETQDTLLVEGGKAERPPLPEPQGNREIVLTTESQRPQATAWRPLTVMSTAAEDAAGTQKLPLQVVVAPAKPRHVVSFKPRWDRPSGLRLCMWEHVPGSRLYEGLYNPFTLPNGKQARARNAPRARAGRRQGNPCASLSRRARWRAALHSPCDPPPISFRSTDLLLHGGVGPGGRADGGAGPAPGAAAVALAVPAGGPPAVRAAPGAHPGQPGGAPARAADADGVPAPAAAHVRRRQREVREGEAGPLAFFPVPPRPARAGAELTARPRASPRRNDCSISEHNFGNLVDESLLFIVITESEARAPAVLVHSPPAPPPGLVLLPLPLGGSVPHPLYLPPPPAAGAPRVRRVRRSAGPRGARGEAPAAAPPPGGLDAPRQHLQVPRPRERRPRVLQHRARRPPHVRPRLEAVPRERPGALHRVRGDARAELDRGHGPGEDQGDDQAGDHGAPPQRLAATPRLGPAPRARPRSARPRGGVLISLSHHLAPRPGPPVPRAGGPPLPLGALPRPLRRAQVLRSHRAPPPPPLQRLPSPATPLSGPPSPTRRRLLPRSARSLDPLPLRP